ncbi:hypothetical protein PACTADRAFT_47869 [Pachysolen tannophilus NRRL Y-2460]|uniref:Uncharacterized protein n=1 Tax=Pachysolen tannophilus NRRL Y-2460 TaxID=669874 RepID=A0A1E4U211_PACTA|nr:hypothetical protein PACTADRAFT_47869 [Pachysolen tannophilus NRRL Y-2460]
MKNLRLLREIEDLKSQLSRTLNSGRDSPSSRSSSNSNGNNHMLDTLGMLASQVLATQEDKGDDTTTHND